MPAAPAVDRRARDRRTATAAAAPHRHGVLTRKALRELGWTDRAIAYRCDSGSWTRLHDGILFVLPGDPPPPARIRAAWLAGGRGAVIAGRAAAYLLGITDEAPDLIDVRVPHARTAAPRSGVRFRRGRRPVRTRWVDGVRVTLASDTVVDLVDWSDDPAAALEWVLAACSRRLTTPARIMESASQRRGLRHRPTLLTLCAEVGDGLTSPLERWHARDVLAAHRLPRGRRQVRRRLAGRTVYSDVEFERFGVVTELDGRLGHEGEAFRDMWRDNAHAADGRLTLRFGWRDTVAAPCLAASQIARALAHRGWRGRLHPCGPDCAAVVQAAA